MGWTIDGAVGGKWRLKPCCQRVPIRAHTHTKLQPSTTPPVREMVLLDDLTGLDAEQCGGGNFCAKSCQF